MRRASPELPMALVVALNPGQQGPQETTNGRTREGSGERVGHVTKGRIAPEQLVASHPGEGNGQAKSTAQRH